MAALILAAGCAKIESKSTSNEAPHAIGFTNYAPRALSKADGSYVGQSGSTTPNATLVANYKFGVYAYSTANTTSFSTSTINKPFMTGTVVTFANNNDGGANNTYSPMRYWPSGDAPDKLTFWAYYPVTDATTTGTIDSPTNGITYTAPTGSNGVGVYEFEAKNTAATMVDFMVSDVVNDQLYSTNNGTVPLVFHHQLTKVQFKFKTTSLTGTTIKLLDAKLYKVKTKGTLKTGYNASSTPSTTTSWESQALASDPVVYDVTFDSVNPEITDDTKWITLGTTASPAVVGTENPAADIFLMVPQDMVDKTSDATNAQYLEVTWEVTTGTVTTRNSQKLYFKNDLKNGDSSTATADDIDWEKNNFITYTITIGPKPIYFTATVENWAAEQNGYFNVQ